MSLTVGELVHVFHYTREIIIINDKASQLGSTPRFKIFFFNSYVNYSLIMQIRPDMSNLATFPGG